MSRNDEALEDLLQFNALVTRLSTRFLSLTDDEIDEAIDDALRDIGEFAEVDRSYVFLFSEDLSRASNTHEWCADGIEPQIDDLHDLPTTEFGYWMKRLERFENVHIPRVSRLSDEERDLREFLAGQGIRSLVAVPLIHGGRLLGFLGFDAVRRRRPWDEREIQLLRLVGDIFANAIQRRRTNRALAEAERQLWQAQKMQAIGQLAAGIAHDFNNLLTVIVGHGELLAADLDEDDPRRELVEEVADAAERGMKLTRQVLTFSRPQPGDPAILDPNRFLESIGGLLRRLMPESIDLRLEPAPGVGSIEIDSGQLEQIVINLVVNARDAISGHGEVSIATRDLELDDAVDVGRYGLDSPGRYVALAVQDTGAGMDDATAARIFEPFFTTKEAGEGTGLGLATVYGIVQRAAGGIRVDTAPGRGTTVEVVFPAYDARRPRDSAQGGMS